VRILPLKKGAVWIKLKWQVKSRQGKQQLLAAAATINIGGVMKLKVKLSLGLGFLFFIIFAMALFCSYYVSKLSGDAESILKDNYDSIVYSRNMMSALDDMRTAISSNVFNLKDDKKITDYYLQLFESGRVEFEKNLNAEKSNITEIQEKEYVEALNSNYDIFLTLYAGIKKGTGSTSMYFNEILPCYEKLKQPIHNINDLNMQAVVRKSQMTKHDSENVIIYMAIASSLCVILAFGYFWYFPFYISNTISHLSNRMIELLKKTGVECDIITNDETYILLQSIKLLEKKLDADSHK
jgi:hypothetical protein